MIVVSDEEDFWKEINTILYSFINNGSTDKMKRDTLIGDYEDGGYRMIDITSQNTASKLSWMKRLINTEGIWKEHILGKLNIDIQYLLRCNLQYKDIQAKLPKGSIWEEIFQKWCKINYIDQVNGIEQVLNQNIWLNSHIRINKKVVCFKDWMEQGIQWIGDLIQENNVGERKFMSEADLTTKLGFKPMFLKYQGLIKAIPNEWKKIIMTNTENEDNEADDYKLIDQITDTIKATKMIYTKIVKAKSKRPEAALNKWRNTLNLEDTNSSIVISFAEFGFLIF